MRAAGARPSGSGARRVVVYVGARRCATRRAGRLAEGFLLAGYRFDRYRSERAASAGESLTLVGEALPPPAEAAALLAGVDQPSPRGVFGARDLVNEPPSVATPRFIAEHAQRARRRRRRRSTSRSGDPKRIAREGLTGSSPSRAAAPRSRASSRCATRGAGARRRRIALVGKGITFDSGGLSLKPAKSMETMKYDMAGGAAVLAAVSVAARARRCRSRSRPTCPPTENLPGGRAQKPGDVIRYANGKTVEVLNTDAEGRLVLADALVARRRGQARRDRRPGDAHRRRARRARRALRRVLGNDQALVDALLAAGRATGERLWQLPLVREYRDDLKSPIADLKNVGGGDAGTIIGALFLARVRRRRAVGAPRHRRSGVRREGAAARAARRDGLRRAAAGRVPARDGRVVSRNVEGGGPTGDRLPLWLNAPCTGCRSAWRCSPGSGRSCRSAP